VTLQPADVLDRIQQLKFDGAFNPYVESCIVYDRPRSPEIRSQILLSILEKATNITVDAVWIGRDLGHKGGRRTGLALTDDLTFERHLSRWHIDVERPTNGSAVKEQTATAIWDMLDQISQNIFLWNVFPLHPHPTDNQFSNRSHTAHERKAGEEVLSLICKLIKPSRIVAIGNDAANSARKLWPDMTVCKVRHPSYGGKKDFFKGIEQIYGFKSAQSQGTLFAE
jgi:uracil-DNA glycosylase